MPSKKKAAPPPTNYEQVEQLFRDNGIPVKKATAVVGRLDHTFDLLNQARVQNLANGLMNWLSANVSPTSGKFPATVTELQMALLLVQAKVFDMGRALETAKRLKSLSKVLDRASVQAKQVPAEAPPDYTPATDISEDARSIYG